MYVHTFLVHPIYVCKKSRKFLPFKSHFHPVLGNTHPTSPPTPLRSQDLTYLGGFMILGFNLGGSKRFSDTEEGRPCQPVGITVVSNEWKNLLCFGNCQRGWNVGVTKVCAWCERKPERYVVIQSPGEHPTTKSTFQFPPDLSCLLTLWP